MIGGLSLTFLLCLATASQFLEGAIPVAFGGALRVDGLSALVLVLCGFVGLVSGTCASRCASIQIRPSAPCGRSAREAPAHVPAAME